MRLVKSFRSSPKVKPLTKEEMKKRTYSRHGRESFKLLAQSK